MNARAWRFSLRAAAITIALTAAIDPAVTSNRKTRPVISLVTAHARDTVLAARLARALDKQFTVVRAPLAAANASVIVGDNLPAGASELARPVFAATAERAGPTVTIESAEAPASSPTAARVPVAALAHITGARGRTLDVSLSNSGVGVDRATHAGRADAQRLRVHLDFVPTAPGATRLRVLAALGGDTTAADLSVDVRDTRWAVLFFDPRPSWMSTFVRRAAESDPRFVVTSRVVTSRNVSTDAGQPPAHLDDLAALELFDAVVIGAPEALADRDVQGLETFMRRRGGSVVLLLDRRAPGPVDRLLDVSAWAADSTGKAETIATASDSMRGADLAWPSRLPDGASAVALARGDATRPIVWSSHVGAGQIIVSGALDAWRFRDPSTSGFDRFWRGVIANAADAAPPPIALAATPAVVTPGERFAVRALVRDAVLSTARPLRASASASLVSNARPTPVRLWPTARAGGFDGDVKAPSAPGIYRVDVSANGARGDIPIVVASDVARPAPEARDLLRAWVAAHGGSTVSAAEIGSLAQRLVAAVHPADRRITWHPMRSAWWILPFALALSLDWWLRRRRGLL